MLLSMFRLLIYVYITTGGGITLTILSGGVASAVAVPTLSNMLTLVLGINKSCSIIG